MKNYFLIIGLSLCFSILSFAQSALKTVTGVLLDGQGKPVPSATVSLPGTRYGTQTDEQGRFTLTVPAGQYTLTATMIGYESVRQSLNVNDTDITTLNLTTQERESALDEVVVTASRRAETINEVPSAVTIVGKRQIAEQTAINADVTNLLQYTVPALAVATGRTSNTGQTLRGRQVLVLVDGVPQSTPLRNGGRDLRIIDPSALERIEVIKGATSIYGNGADGGIINYITKRPETGKPFSSQTWAGLTSGLSHGSGTQGFRLSQQFTGKTGRTDYVLNGTYERSGLLKDANGAVISPFYNTGQMNNYNLLAKVGHTLTDRQRVELMYNYYASQSKLGYVEKLGTYGKTPTIGVPTSNEMLGTPQGTPYNHNLTLRYTYDRLVGGTGLEVVLYGQRFRTVYGYEAQFFENGGQSNVVSNKQGVRLNLNTPFRLGKALDGELLYGLDLLGDNTAQKLEDGRFWTPDMAMQNLAPYAQLKLDILNNLILKAGARFENIRVRVSDFTTLKTYNASTQKYDGGVAVQGGNLRYEAFVGNVGLRYAGLRFFQPFVSYSQAFSINELGRILRTSQRSIVSQLPTEPIIVNNYEAGVAGDVGRLLHYDLALFRSRSALGASFRQSASGVFEIVRSPENVWGYELAVELRPTRFLAVGGGYAYVEGKTDANNDGTYEAYLGSDRIMAPKTTAYVRLTPSQRWSLTVNALRSGERNRFAPNARGLYTYGQGPVTPYTLVNVNGSLNLTSKTTLTLGIENLLNADYYPAISQWAARDADYIKAPGARGMLTVSHRF
ncbi:TonB-dependent receptor plug domain-containing protein [Rudanella paleaurantiibacter]|uniref:TonB-dependent receptor plug domain-containing protein n=1 Tax=Rudanella paleaurantiibacter TaxID=2614655 RepID=A0A7J5U2P1_9BACT|nr:TonB-dependent receptor [Rudanella paleaurantiibacter]KAB7732064.1 TonB-dependent receptor plug domain-containing protein [Rudanella paleaurantiibacter]